MTSHASRQLITHVPIRLVLIIVLTIAAGSLAAFAPGMAQPSPSSGPPESPILAQENGYRELVEAGGLLRTSKRFSALFPKPSLGPSTPPTLAQQQEVLLDRPVAKALALLRDGLSRQVFTLPEEHSSSPPFADLGAFRDLARLLKVQQYVFLADGRVGDALDDARLGLRLGHVIQTNGLLFGLTGLAISSMGLHSLGGHLDQLSAPDCELLYQICVKWLDQPDPIRAVMESERQLAKRRLEEYVKSASASENDPSLPDELKELRARSPADYEATLAEAGRQIDASFDRELADLSQPARTPAEPNSAGEKNLAERLVAAATPFPELLNRVVGAYQREEEAVRLLACHAVIHRYRWEHDRLPASLAVLSLGRLAIDPFTGQTLSYAVHGRSYRLTSAGPPAAADDPRAVNGRVPVSIEPAD